MSLFILGLLQVCPVFVLINSTRSRDLVLWPLPLQIDAEVAYMCLFHACEPTLADQYGRRPAI